ncbi:YhgE/Pip domain-containing protein [Cytobacillus sp. FSL R7-0696]|uniref:YhgE/Pip domain-containing protein n=1 Tax=Cytobacillus sp. FSL R7-0696 TaxID=2921691 RepID=UPI0030FC8122
MKIIKWMLITASLFFFPVMNIHAESQTVKGGMSKGKVANKNEVIYANLLADGNLTELYVVNSFELIEPGVIEDFGNYQKVKNLTDTSKISKENDQITLQAKEENYYYQGNLPNNFELPWRFTINYYLNNKKVEPENLAGKSGDIKMEIAVEANEGKRSSFSENYMLQISVPLNTEKFKEIKAENATVAQSGKDKQLTFTVMPEQEEVFTIEAETNHFETEGVQISALPASLAIDSPDTEELTSEFHSLTEAIGDIHHGVGDLAIGMNELSSGLRSLEGGSAQYKKGLNELSQSGNQLTEGSAQINNTLSLIKDEMKQASGVSGIGELENVTIDLPEVADNLEQAANDVDQVVVNYNEVKTQINRALEQIPDNQISDKEINKLYESNADKEVIDQLVETYRGTKAAQEVLLLAKDNLTDMVEPLSTFSQSMREAAGNLRAISSNIDESILQIDIDEGLKQLTSGVEEMVSNYNQFHQGLLAYTGGVSELSTSYSDIHEGISGSLSGAEQLTKGAGSLHNGTGQLHDATKDIPDEVTKEVDEMISQYDKSDYEPISFVSDKNNEKLELVQFVIQTDKIKIKDNKEDVKETKDKVGFFEKLLNLFK